MGAYFETFLKEVVNRLPKSKHQFTAVWDYISIRPDVFSHYNYGQLRFKIWAKSFAFVPKKFYSKFQERAEEKEGYTLKSLRLKFDLKETERPEAVAKDLFPVLLKFVKLLKTCEELENRDRNRNREIIRQLKEFCGTDSFQIEKKNKSVAFSSRDYGHVRLIFDTIDLDLAKALLKAGGFQK